VQPGSGATDRPRRIGRDVFLPFSRALELDQVDLRLAATVTQTFGLVVTARPVVAA
jgi:hypothetical protein